MRDHGNTRRLYPNVLGQSGTASAAPVFVTSPPKRISTNVAAAVVTARRYATPRASVPRHSRPRSGRLRLRQEVGGRRLRRAVLVGAAGQRGHGGAPVQVRR